MGPAEGAGVAIGFGSATLTTSKPDFSTLAPGDQSCSCAVGNALGAGRAIAAGVTGWTGAAAGAGWRVAIESTNPPDAGNDEVGAGVTERATNRSTGVGLGSCVAASRRCFSTDNR